MAILKKKAKKGILQNLSLLCLLCLLCAGCTDKGEEKADTASLEETAIVAIEERGEFDPIANPKAVKGGTYTTWGSSFPKSLNVFLDSNSFSAEVTGMFFEPLVSLHTTKNEPVGILAESWTVSPDKKTFTFKIHPVARWSDGKPVTAEDVQFYYDVMMNPKNMTSIYRVSLKRFDRPKIIDTQTIEISAKEIHWKNFWDACGMVALPKHVWKDVDFNKQNFAFPVVSGPYSLKEVKKNRYIVLERRPDWWGRIKRYNQYKYNFDYIKYKFMEDRNKALEAFKKGEFDAYAIYTSSIWAKKTDFEQVKKGWVVKQRVYNREPKGFQGFAINLRRPLFQDVRVREALCHLLNRESMNEKLMFNEYFLLNSYYPDLFPDNVNPAVPFRTYNPEKARALLHDAGWRVGSDGFLQKDGKTFEISFLTYSVDHRHLNIYLEDMKKVGIKARIEQLSMSSVRKRLDNHEFDLYWINWGASRLRDPESLWHSSTADQIATNNISGVKDSKVDQLTDAQKTEMSLDRRNDILKKIDKRLNEIIPYVFLWQADHNRILYWNRFGTPAYVFDKFSREDSIIAYWWIDPNKDRALKEAIKNNTPLPQEPEVVRYRD
ncbi:MAG: ABC transporter substrate-binding protein [Deltaproteobacteria bacterium]|nr:ABC transporter substrate-binding protein [Deltaproteobacteria bacterium]